jgi:hypothetical protein
MEEYLKGKKTVVAYINWRTIRITVSALNWLNFMPSIINKVTHGHNKGQGL